jgi:hypothetical protein
VYQARKSTIQAMVAVLAIVAGGAALDAQDKAAKDAAKKDAVKVVKPKELREAVIARAVVRVPVNPRTMDLKAGPKGPGAFANGASVDCTYVDKKMGGASPKFACRLANGDEVKVKYGGTNGEVYAEVIATRLLWALGFGADHMYSVRVVCHECPQEIAGVRRENGDLVLDPAAIERKMPGEEVLDRWDWAELDIAGGASKADRDALKLLAVLLQHSDSKPEQQRVVCLRAGRGGACAKPLMMIQDVGITFGQANAFNAQPKGSVNLAAWTRIPIWTDAPECVGNLAGSFKGTLKYPVISEGGRALLAGLLMQLSDAQLRNMFDAARVQLRPRAPESGESGFPAIGEWVEAFKAKRAEIVSRRCAA